MYNDTSTGRREGWQGEPPGRGTWVILSSCVLTLILCVWTALHLNIPCKPEKSTLQRYLQPFRSKMGRVLVGILAPEAMVYMAWGQWINARTMTNTIRSRRRERKTSSKWEWTDAHSFFACMGGFVLDHTSYSTKADCPSLTMDGILYTAWTEPDLLDIPVNNINDRSRADSIGKILVCTQASYFLLQVLARLNDRLPVTLLEVNTLCHVICAFIVYGFWFYKPFDVQETISIRPRWAEDLDAIYSMRLRSFTAHCTRKTWDFPLSENEVFDHYRVQSRFQLCIQQQQPSKRNENHTYAVGAACASNLVSLCCARCHKLKRSVLDYPQLSSQTSAVSNLHYEGSNAFDQYIQRFILDDDIMYQYGELSEMPTSKVSNPLKYSTQRSNSILPSSTHSMSIFDANLKTPSYDKWSQKLIIKRGMPDKFEIGTWEINELVLVLHGLQPNTEDEAIKSRLWQSKLWLCLTQVVLVPGHMPNQAYFRYSHNPTRWEYLGLGDCSPFSGSARKSHVICGVALDMAGLRRWEVAFDLAAHTKSTSTYDKTALKRVLAIKPRREPSRSMVNNGFSVSHASHQWRRTKSTLLADSVSNWPQSNELSKRGKGWMPQVALALATALYGGTHALAWHGNHPTNAERILWNVSSLMVAVSGAIMTPLLVLYLWLNQPRSRNSNSATSVPQSDDTLDDDTTSGLHSAIESGVILMEPSVKNDASLWAQLYDSVAELMLLLFLSLAASYFAARAYLVVESFISLRALPIGAYTTPAWTDSLLHW